MSIFACHCGKRKVKSLSTNELHFYKLKYRFSDNELLEFRQRFKSLASTRGLIDKPSFMESMGVLGLDNGSFLSEKIFQVIDGDKDGYIRLEDYLTYFDILIYGSESEKHGLTFRMIDTDCKGWFHFEEFNELIMMMLHTWNTMTGENYNLQQNKKLQTFIEAVYQKFVPKKEDKVTMEVFQRTLEKEPNLLEIFDYFAEGIIDTIQPLSDFEHQNKELVQELEGLQIKVRQLRTIIAAKKENSPRTSQIPCGSIFQVHKPKESKDSSIVQPGSPEAGRRVSIFQTLDHKIKKTALFEHIIQELEAEAAGNNLKENNGSLVDGMNNLQAEKKSGVALLDENATKHIERGTLNVIREGKTEVEPYKGHQLLTPNQSQILNNNREVMNKSRSNIMEKDLMLEDVRLTQSTQSTQSKQGEKRLVHAKTGLKLDEIKKEDSRGFQSEELNQYFRQLSSIAKMERKNSRNATVRQRKNTYRVNIEPNYRCEVPEDDEKLSTLEKHVDMIEDEMFRIIEEIHNKRRHNNKTDKMEDDNKMEMMKEVTTHNIHKTTEVKKGNLISFGHHSWNLVLNMMLGIQTAVRSAVEHEFLSVKHFNVKYIFELIPRRTGQLKDTYKICKFFDYAPSVFNEIRKLYGIKNEEYLKSLGPEPLLNGLIQGNLSTLAELTSTGKSGSFFYYSADGKYTLKTVSREEFHFLRNILSNYYNHIIDYPNTLMIKFFGLHKIRFMKGSQGKPKIYFVIMANVFNTSREIHVRYDLKGSTQGRFTKDEDPSVAKKDLNILHNKEKIMLSQEAADTLLQVLEKDSRFFEENNIIDYSLLVGIHNLEQEELSTKDMSLKKATVEFKTQSKDGIISTDGSKMYFFGIIDILTQFNMKKKTEYLFKRMAYGKGISAIPPRNYAQRFLNFIKGLLEVSPVQ